MKNKVLQRTAAVALLLMMPTTAYAEDAPVKITSAQAIKGTQAVAIGAFTVGFIFESVDNGKATGGLIGAFGGATKAKSILVGVTPETMQAVTDAAYADFTAQLAAQGFTVADTAAMFESAEFQKVKTVPTPHEVKVQLEKSKGKATYFKPTALPGLMLFPGDITASGFGGFGGAMSAGMNQYHVTMYTKSANQSVIDVVYLIDFSQLKRPGAFSFGGLQVNSGMAVVDEYSKLTLVNPAGKSATILVKQPVAVEGDFASKEDTTKGAGLQTAANVLGGIAAAGGLGGMMFGKSKTFTFTAKDSYRDGAIKAATLTNAKLVQQLVALR